MAFKKQQQQKASSALKKSKSINGFKVSNYVQLDSAVKLNPETGRLYVAKSGNGK